MADKTQEHKEDPVHAHRESSGSTQPTRKPGWQLSSCTPTNVLVSLSKTILHSPTNTPICHPKEKPFNNLRGKKLLTTLLHPSAQLTADDVVQIHTEHLRVLLNIAPHSLCLHPYGMRQETKASFQTTIQRRMVPHLE